MLFSLASLEGRGSFGVAAVASFGGALRLAGCGG